MLLSLIAFSVATPEPRGGGGGGFGGGGRNYQMNDI